MLYLYFPGSWSNWSTMATGYRSWYRKRGVRHQPQERARERTRDRNTKGTNKSKWWCLFNVGDVAQLLGTAVIIYWNGENG